MHEMMAISNWMGEVDLHGGHFDESCVHISISFDLGDDAGLTVSRTFGEHAAALVHRYGSSLCGRPQWQKFLELKP